MCNMPTAVFQEAVLLRQRSTANPTSRTISLSLTTLGACRLACAGLPSASGIRAQAWQLLLNYIPAQRCEWDKVLAKRRAEYSSFCADFSLTPTQAVRMSGTRASMRCHETCHYI